ncbi:MAG TPA: amino acid adenylation domain-containing protein [Dictyobacter sp.]|jgi:amino acid adenylation domain-containing protein|nr:amino acid adenylation domain-containing protein [Dictyobacter sp.]
MTEAPRLNDLSSEAKRALLARLLREKVKTQESWGPISHNQKALWFLYRLAPESAAYNLLYAARVRSHLDIPALQRTLQKLAQRYPILTATYSLKDGAPAQKVPAQGTIPLEQRDGTAFSLEEIQQKLLVESNQPIDLEKGPILRVVLYQHGPADYVLAFIVHHIAVDFWALDILVDELYLLYLAEKTGVTLPLPQPGPQHNEYVQWQNDMLASAEGENHWHYWKDLLQGELPLLNLPTDHPRPAKQTYNGASHGFAIDPALTQQLRTLATSEKVTLFTLMLTAYEALLYRYTNQDDIIVGTPALGRNKADWERVIDYLANPVLVRSHLDTATSFKTLLEQTRQGMMDALEHQDFPFPYLVERLQPKRDSSHSPIYQTLFIWDRPRKHNMQDLARLGQPELAQAIAQEGLAFEPFVFGQQGAPFDLTITVFEIDGALTADFRFNVDLFEASTIERIAQHFQVLLRGIASNPDQSLLKLPLLTENERRQMLFDWNATNKPYPSMSSLHRLVEEQVARTPEQTALIFEGKTRTYRELNQEANQLAHRLQAMGVGPDVLVGVCMERSFEMVVALLAIIKAGGAYVPMDPTYPAERLAYMLEDAQVPVLLTQRHLQQQLPATSARTITVDPGWNANSTDSQENPFSQITPDNLAYMIYTSGSTGKPKGVMNTHKGICNRLNWMQNAYQLTTHDRVLQKTPFSFDVSVWEFFWPLISGATMVIARPGGHQDPAYLAQLIAEQRVTTTHFVPSMLQVFLQDPNVERCQSLRHVICSGEALTTDLQERFFKRFAPKNQFKRLQANVQLHNLYGPTEAAIDVTHWECQPGQDMAIGYPIDNTQLYILNASLQPVPVGMPGELHIGGVGLARGYYRRPELTAEKFIRNPFSTDPTARLFKTGDLARYRADGAIEFLGRIDHQVKIRGFRIELGEIEETLLQHSAIKETVVVAQDDVAQNKRLIAYLVAHSSSDQPSIEILRTHLKTTLPDYMIPAVFMYLDALPLAPNGKVDRRALPAPDTERPDLEVAFVAPRTQTEQTLTAIWSQVLGIDKIGINDNYFDLGGASIQSLDIISKSTEAGLPLKLEMLFEFQTVAELAAAIDEQRLSAVEQAQEVVEIHAPTLQDTPPVESTQPAPTGRTKTDFDNNYIESLGTYLPATIITSDEIMKGCVNPVRFPLARLTGIRTRHVTNGSEFSIDLAIKAVEQCLANSKYNPEDIDMIVCGNISRYNAPNMHFTYEPSSAVQIQQHFGFDNALTFDVNNACTGLFTSAYIIDSFIKAGIIRRGIAVSGEYISHMMDTAQKEIENYMDSRLACLTVGDAGAALILDKAPDKSVGFHEFDFYTVGRYSDACIGKATEQEHGGAIMFTDAVTVSSVNLKQAVSHAGLMIERSQWPKEAFQHVIVHQTSKTTINDVPREINKFFGKELVDQSSVINNIAERANTATTTHMVAVMDNIRSNRIQSGDNAIFGITGSGATIGTAIYTFDDLPDRIRRREAGEYTPVKVKPEGRFISHLPTTRRVGIESIGTLAANSIIEKKTLPLAEAAGSICLNTSILNKEDIDLLVFTGVYRDEFLSEPAVASMIQGALDINADVQTQQDKKTFCLDLYNGSLGTLNACYTAIGMMESQKIKTAMIVASEIENNRETKPEALGGIEETGSALILRESTDGRTGFGNFVFRSFTEYMEARQAYTSHEKGRMLMNFEQAPQFLEYYARCIQDTVNELLSIEHLDMSQIRVILPPQISPDFLTALSNKLEVERERLVDVHATHDLFTSSLPYTLQQVQKQQLAKPGDIGLIINVGAGIQVGCATYYF